MGGRALATPLVWFRRGCAAVPRFVAWAVEPGIDRDQVELLTDPQAWIAFFTLTALELVLGIDNIIFISILVDRLPAARRELARRIGLGLAMFMRIALLLVLAWIVGLTAPLFSVLGEEISGRDLILIAGGIFLVWKATNEIHHSVDTTATTETLDKKNVAVVNFGSAIVQILLLDIVLSIDSILTAVGMTDHLPVMIIAVVVAVIVMLVAADPLANFINKNPTIVMLALGFLLMIGAVLIADGFGVHVPKGYIYAAMAFSAGVESLNMLARRRKPAASADKTLH